MFDPMEANGQQIESRKSVDIEFNICDVANSCRCNVQVRKLNKSFKILQRFYPKVEWVKETQPLIAGQDTNMVLGHLKLTNLGDEPAVKDMLTININQTLYRLSSTKLSCDNKDEQYNCKLPFLSGNDKGKVQEFDLSVTSRNPILPTETSVSMDLTFESSCSGETELDAVSLYLL